MIDKKKLEEELLQVSSRLNNCLDEAEVWWLMARQAEIEKLLKE